MDHVDPSAPPPPLADPLEEVRAYWQALRHGRAVPARADLDPERLGPWLPMAALVEIGAGDRMRFRVGGQGLRMLLGVEPRGMPLRSLFALGTRARLQDLGLRVFSGPAMLTMTLIATTPPPTMRPVQVALVMLPLRDRHDRVTQALLCLDGKAARTVERPARFHIRQARLTALGDAALSTPLLRLIHGGRT